MPDPPIRMLLWGEFDTNEMRPLALHLLALPATIVACRDVLRLEAFARALDDEPALAVAFQSWPDEFPKAAVERAIALFPLARWVCCHGAWCASDGRTRAAWPLAARVPVASAPARIARELAVIRGAIPPLFLTASRDETFAFDHAESR